MSLQHPHRLRLPNPEYIDVDGVNTCFYKAGEGKETIVLIYGGNFGMLDPAVSASEWGYNFEALSKKYTVIAFDKLGQGYTDPPKTDADYTMHAVTQHAIKFLDTLKIKAAHIVGHSRGGVPATRLAIERSDLVKTLSIVCSSTLSPGVGLNEVTIGRPPYEPGSEKATRWACEACCFKPETVTNEWIESSKNILSLDTYQVGIQKMLDEQLLFKQFIPQLASYKRETFKMIEEGRLQRPTQIIWGANDPTAIVERGYRLYKMMKEHERNISFHIFNEAGHFPFAEHPERFNAMLSNFVDLYSSEQY